MTTTDIPKPQLPRMSSGTNPVLARDVGGEFREIRQAMESWAGAMDGYRNDAMVLRDVGSKLNNAVQALMYELVESGAREGELRAELAAVKSERDELDEALGNANSEIDEHVCESERSYDADDIAHLIRERHSEDHYGGFATCGDTLCRKAGQFV